EKNQIQNKHESTRGGFPDSEGMVVEKDDETANAPDMSDDTDNHCNADEETVDLVVEVVE
ncbi:hypothetical protein L195_g043666, partial [Trifolium pratense]